MNLNPELHDLSPQSVQSKDIMKLSLKNATSSILTKQVSPFGVTTTFPNKKQSGPVAWSHASMDSFQRTQKPTLNVPLKFKTFQCFYWWKNARTPPHFISYPFLVPKDIQIMSSANQIHSAAGAANKNLGDLHGFAYANCSPLPSVSKCSTFQEETLHFNHWRIKSRNAITWASPN